MHLSFDLQENTYGAPSIEFVTWLLYNRETGIFWRRQMYAQLQLITKRYKWYEKDCIIFWLNGYILR